MMVGLDIDPRKSGGRNEYFLARSCLMTGVADGVFAFGVNTIATATVTLTPSLLGSPHAEKVPVVMKVVVMRIQTQTQQMQTGLPFCMD